MALKTNDLEAGLKGKQPDAPSPDVETVFTETKPKVQVREKPVEQSKSQGPGIVKTKRTVRYKPQRGEYHLPMRDLKFDPKNPKADVDTKLVDQLLATGLFEVEA